MPAAAYTVPSSHPVLCQAAFIGWQPRPFQLEVGVAELAFGVTTCVAFWRSLPFKAAITCVFSIAHLGDAVGHVHQMLIAGNFSPGNAGVIFYCDVIIPIAAIAMLILAPRIGEGQFSSGPAMLPRRMVGEVAEDLVDATD